MYTDLRAFVEALDQAGELFRITEPVDPLLEIAHRADRESKERCAGLGSADSQRTDPEFCAFGGKALLFEHPIGSDIPILINAFGSYKRIEMALGGRPLAEIAEQIAGLVKPEPPRSLGEALSKAKQFAPLLRIGPKRSKKRGVCQQIVRTGDEIDLTTLPILRCWQHDGDFASMGYPSEINTGIDRLGHPSMSEQEWDERFRGRFITLAGIHTIHADDRDDPKPKSHNIGMYRVQLMGKDRLAMHWHMHHDGASHWRSWKAIGEAMPVAIALGGPSVLPYGATCPLPPGISELLMAGFLQGKGVKLCRAHSVPLFVPSESEIVIEGFVRTDAGYPGYEPRDADAGELGDGAVFEGPFGDHTGFYSMPDRYPIVEVSAVTHRERPIYPTTVVGLPPQEDYALGKATERVMLPLLKTILPDIVDYHLPLFGAFHNVAFVQIDKHYPLHARKVMHGIWGAGQMAWTKNIFIVDSSVDVHDLTAVLGAMAERCKPSRDIECAHGALDILDHAAPRLGAGMKLGFDLTKKIEGEEIAGDLLAYSYTNPSAIERDEDTERICSIEGVLSAASSDDAPGWVFVRADRGYDERDREKLGHSIIGAICGVPTHAKFIVVLGRDVDIQNRHEALFHWVANCDASRDAVWDQSHACDRVLFDATPKTSGDARNGQPVRAWPEILSDGASIPGSGELMREHAERSTDR
jgi:4-hydroxy-3-polyprenylbenzoate decarboxylase